MRVCEEIPVRPQRQTKDLKTQMRKVMKKGSQVSPIKSRRLGVWRCHKATFQLLLLLLLYNLGQENKLLFVSINIFEANLIFFLTFCLGRTDYRASFVSRQYHT